MSFLAAFGTAMSLSAMLLLFKLLLDFMDDGRHVFEVGAIFIAMLFMFGYMIFGYTSEEDEDDNVASVVRRRRRPKWRRY